MQNITIINKNGNIFKTYTEDIKNIKNSKQFVKELFKYLNVGVSKKKTHKKLVKYLKYLNNRYTKRITEEELQKCRNNKDPITYEDLKDIPEQRLVLINEHNDMYDCFDVVTLRKYLFDNKKDKYFNPLTMSEIDDVDMKKILNVNIRHINYFC